MKYKKLFFLFLLMTSIHSSADEIKRLRKNIIGSKELPMEINFLLINLQKDSTDYFDTLMPIIKSIDQSARALKKEEIFMIGKVEVYKTLLKNYNAPIRRPVDGNSIKILKSGIAKAHDNFMKWFLQALLEDTNSLINNPTFKEYLLQKNSPEKVEKPEYKKLEKKSSLLQYWISKISPEDEDFPNSFTKELAPRLLDTLRNIDNSFYLLAMINSGNNNVTPSAKRDDNLIFFAINEIADNPPSKKLKEKAVEEILAPISGATTLIMDTTPASTPPLVELPVPTGEKWSDDENSPANLKNLPKPSNDADWLQDF